MKKVNNLFLLVGLSGILMSSVHAEDSSPTLMLAGRVEDRSRICMIDDNVQTDPGIEYVHKDKTYYLCCAGCLNKFGSNPDYYSQAADPVSGEIVDKAQAAIYAHKGRAYFFASDSNLQEFEKNPDLYLASASEMLFR